MNNFFSQRSISKVVSINLMWIFFHQFFQTNFSWLIFVQSEFSYKNKMKYSMLLYSNYTYKCLFLFLFLFSILDFVDIFVSRKSCPFRCLSVCFAIANWYILHVMHSFKPKKKILTIIIIKKLMCIFNIPFYSMCFSLWCVKLMCLLILFGCL